MKVVERMGAQGDVIFRRVTNLPVGAQAAPHSGRLVVAHSETQHHHAIDDVGVVRYEVGNPLVCYLQIDGSFADVVHHRSFDTHETLRLLGGGSIWECRRQREWTPEGWRRVED